jgi:hypothetical protein
METRVNEKAIDGCPAWAPAAAIAAQEVEPRRRRKREERLRRDAVRLPDSWERFRMLLEVVDQERNVVEIADHKARYGLVILGVINTILFVLLARGSVFQSAPEWVAPWLTGLVALYLVLTFLFVLHAIECLRPRELADKDSVHRAGILGILFWEGIVQHDLAEYRREWSEVRMEQLTTEAAAIAFRLSHLIQAKYRALRRLYNGLVVLLALCTLLLAAYAAWGSVP